MKSKILKLTLGLSAIAILQSLNSCSTMSKGGSNALPNAPGTTSNAENLIRETNDAGSESYPRISPDGKYLLYCSQESSSTSISDLFNSLSNPSSSSKSKGKIIKKEIGLPITNPLLADAADAAWYPDGKNVIFSYKKPNQPVIVKTNFDGVGLNYISQSALGNDDSNPNITSDNNTIIFTTLIGGNRMICLMDTKGGRFTVVTDGDHVAINPTNNNEIIYNLKVNNNAQIFSMDLKTGRKSQLTTGEFNSRDGAFSRDGKWIAFASNRENPKSSKYHIYIMRSDGTDLKQLTQGDTFEGDPTWSPNGEIFFYSNADNNYNIWRVKPRSE